MSDAQRRFAVVNQYLVDWQRFDGGKHGRRQALDVSPRVFVIVAGDDGIIQAPYEPANLRCPRVGDDIVVRIL